MAITTFKLDSKLLQAMSKAKQLGTNDAEREVELILLPKFTDAYKDELDSKEAALSSSYDVDGDAEWLDEIVLSSELESLGDSDPFITSSKIWWGNDTTGIHIYWDLNEQYSTLDDIEQAFDNGFEDRLFNRIYVVDQGKEVANVLFRDSGFSITLGKEITFAIEGSLPTSVSEFEDISDALTALSEYLSDDGSFSRNTMIYHLDILLKYGVDEIYFDYFDERILSIFNESNKAGVSIGGLEIAINGNFPNISSQQAMDFIDYIKNVDEGDIDELLATINVTHQNLTVTNSNGVVLLTLNTHSDQQQLEDDIQIIDEGLTNGLWVDGVPSDLFAYEDSADSSSNARKDTNSVSGSASSEPSEEGADSSGGSVELNIAKYVKHYANDSVDEVFEGSSAIDTVIFDSPHREIVKTDGGFEINGDLLSGIERVQFADADIALDTDGATSAGGIYRLYKATFNREPDTGGLGYWIAQADADNKDAVRMAEDFTWSAEFQNLYNITTTDNYGTGTDVSELVTGFYENVLGRTPDADGLNYYTGVIESHEKTVGRVLAEISDSPENYDNTIELIQNGIQYDLWVG